MTQWHLKSKRKKSGGLRYSNRRCDKKKVWKGRDPAHTKMMKGEKEKRKRLLCRGHTEKVRLTEAVFAQVLVNGKSQKVQITNVVINDADRHFARRQILTKGAIFEGKLGNELHWFRVTNRPGQVGVVQAKMLTEEEKKTIKERLERKTVPKEKKEVKKKAEKAKKEKKTEENK